MFASEVLNRLPEADPEANAFRARVDRYLEEASIIIMIILQIIILVLILTHILLICILVMLIVVKG